MELVVHDGFPFNGTDYKRGDVIRGADADAVKDHPIFRLHCSQRADQEPPVAPFAPSEEHAS